MAKPFLTSLADWLEARAALNGITPRRLWAHAIEEGAEPITAPVSRLTIYGGQPNATAPVRHATVQCYTRHKSAAQAMAQAELLRSKLCDETGLPVCGVGIDDYTLKSVANLTAPGLLGRDAEKRAEIVFNFECHYLPA